MNGGPATMLRATLLALSRRRQLRRWAEHSRWGRRISQRFVAGQQLDDALAAAQALNRQGLEVSLDPLGEHVSTPGAAAAAAGGAVAILEAIALHDARANLSLKLTQLGLDLDAELAAAHLREVLTTAARLGNFVRVDMEGAAYTQATLALVERMHAAGLPVGAVLQAALYRSGADLERLLELGVPVRLVKGAYQEPADRAWQRKTVVDGCYLRLVRRLLDAAAAMPSAGHAAVATHDERMIRAAIGYARQRRLPPSGFEFQMLYGIRRDLQRQLQREGWRVRVYVPFGPAWYPYFMRRLAERPANLAFVLKNLGN